MRKSQTEIAEPSRAKLLEDKEDPTWEKSNTDVADAHRTKERNNEKDSE